MPPPPGRISKILSFPVNVLYLGDFIGGIAYVIVVTYSLLLWPLLFLDKISTSLYLLVNVLCVQFLLRTLGGTGKKPEYRSTRLDASIS